MNHMFQSVKTRNIAFMVSLRAVEIQNNVKDEVILIEINENSVNSKVFWKC